MLVPVSEGEYNHLGRIQYQHTHTSSWGAAMRYYKRAHLDEWLDACEQRINNAVTAVLTS